MEEDIDNEKVCKKCCCKLDSSGNIEAGYCETCAGEIKNGKCK